MALCPDGRQPPALSHDRLLNRPFARNLVLHGGDGDNLTAPAGNHLRTFRNGGPIHGYIDLGLSLESLSVQLPWVRVWFHSPWNPERRMFSDSISAS